MPIIRTVAVAALAATLAGAPAARADLKVVQSTTVKNPQLTAMMQSMSPAERAQMGHTGFGALFGGGAITTTVYTRGTKTRLDVGPSSTIVDTAAHKVISVNRTTRTYSTSAYSPSAAAGQVQATIRDTGQTKIILGHPARHYTLSLTSARMPSGRISGDIWSAQDLPQLPSAAFSGGPAAALQGQFRKIKGMPLIVNMVVAGSPVGDITTRTITKSVSHTALPTSLFVVPAGYKRTAATPQAGGAMMGQ